MQIVCAVAAILVDQDKRVLIAERPAGKFMEGYWEFPGGKMEQGETPEAALRREVQEEMGVQMGCMAPLSFISEARSDHHALVLVYICREWKGIAAPQEGQQAAWVRIPQLRDYRLLPGNVPLLPIMRDMV